MTDPYASFIDHLAMLAFKYPDEAIRVFEEAVGKAMTWMVMKGMEGEMERWWKK